jgi:hypothetical protein
MKCACACSHLQPNEESPWQKCSGQKSRAFTCHFHHTLKVQVNDALRIGMSAKNSHGCKLSEVISSLGTQMENCSIAAGSTSFQQVDVRPEVRCLACTGNKVKKSISGELMTSAATDCSRMGLRRTVAICQGATGIIELACCRMSSGRGRR